MFSTVINGLIILLSFVYAVIGQSPSKMNVRITNVRPGIGTLVIAVFDSKDDFLKKPAFSQIVEAKASTVEMTFAVREGEYALAVFQDLNRNNRLDKNFVGIPKEPYGFSNNFRPLFSGPAFRDCKVEVKGAAIVSIGLR